MCIYVCVYIYIYVCIYILYIDVYIYVCVYIYICMYIYIIYICVYMCVYTYIYIFMYVYIYIIYMCIYMCVCIYIYICVCIYIYMCIYVCVYIYIYIFVYVYIYIYMCVCIYIYLCMYIYIYVYIYVCVYIYIYMRHLFGNRGTVNGHSNVCSGSRRALTGSLSFSLSPVSLFALQDICIISPLAVSDSLSYCWWKPNIFISAAWVITSRCLSFLTSSSLLFAFKIKTINDRLFHFLVTTIRTVSQSPRPLRTHA